MKPTVFFIGLFTFGLNLFYSQTIQFSSSGVLANLLDPNITFTDVTAIDANGDGEIQVSEANQITALSIFSATSTLESSDLEHFSNITHLRIFSSTVNTLNASAFSSLFHLELGTVTLNGLNITNMPQLKYLSCPFSTLSTIDFTNSENIEYIDFRSNSFETLDVTNLPVLEELNCSYNDITTLLLPNDNLNLEIVNATNNQLSELTLPTAGNIQKLYLSYNPIVTLEVKNVPYLDDYNFLNCPNLECISFRNIQMGTNHYVFYVNQSNSSLTHIGYDQEGFETIVFNSLQVGGLLYIVNYEEGVFCENLSTEDIQSPNGNFVLTPNPAKDFFTIQSEAQINKVELFDASGRLVKSFVGNASSYNISQLSEGVYVVKVYTATQTQNVSFIKK